MRPGINISVPEAKIVDTGWGSQTLGWKPVSEQENRGLTLSSRFLLISTSEPMATPNAKGQCLFEVKVFHLGSQDDWSIPRAHTLWEDTSNNHWRTEVGDKVVISSLNTGPVLLSHPPPKC